MDTNLEIFFYKNFNRRRKNVPTIKFGRKFSMYNMNNFANNCHKKIY